VTARCSMSIQAVSAALSVKAGSTGAKAVLIALASHADESGQCWPSQRRIAELAEMSVDSVQRHLKELEARGVVTRECRHRPDGGRWSDRYRLTLPRHDKQAPPPPQNAGTPTAKCGDPAPVPAETPTAYVRPIDESSLNLSLKKESRSVAHATRPDPMFEKLWAIYPKREGSNPKKPARAKFLRLVRDGADPEQIIAGAKHYAELEHKNLGMRYIKTTIAWLNQWSPEDDAPSPAMNEAKLVGFFVEADTADWKPWREHSISTIGVPPPQTDIRWPDRTSSPLRRGWIFPTQFPPAAEPDQQPLARAA
jgi:hypothetical protein